MERETKEITTPGGHVVKLNTWLTGREKRELSSAFLQKVSVGQDGIQDIELTGEIINKVQDLTLENVVVSVDGAVEDIVNKVLDMKSEDYDFIIAEMNKITNKDEDVKKN